MLHAVVLPAAEIAQPFISSWVDSAVLDASRRCGQDLRPKDGPTADLRDLCAHIHRALWLAQVNGPHSERGGLASIISESAVPAVAEALGRLVGLHPLSLLAPRQRLALERDIERAASADVGRPIGRTLGEQLAVRMTWWHHLANAISLTPSVEDLDFSAAPPPSMSARVDWELFTNELTHHLVAGAKDYDGSDAF